MTDVAWELCSRCLSRETNEGRTLGTSELAQLIVYWLEEGLLPDQMRQAIYQGMQEDLSDRGKRVETEADTQAMTCRWVKQLLHRELDAAREMCLSYGEHFPVDLDIDFEMTDAQARSMTAETEQEAARLQENLGTSRSAQAETSLSSADAGSAVEEGQAQTWYDVATEGDLRWDWEEEWWDPDGGAEHWEQHFSVDAQTEEGAMP